MNRAEAVYVAGTRTLLGAAMLQRLRDLGFERICVDAADEPDAADPMTVRARLLRDRPRTLVCAGGDSGGIAKNQRQPWDLMLGNLRVVTAVVPAAFEAGVERLLYLGS